MYAVYIKNTMDEIAIPPSKRFVFVFCEERELTKLSIAPNISMQLSYFDEENYAIVFVLTDARLTTIYENVLPPNSYLLVLDEKTLNHRTAFQYLYTYCITHQVDYAFFAEWYSVLSKKVTETESLPINMNKNPKYEWKGDGIYADFSEWLNTMVETIEYNNYASLGVCRRNSTDLLRLCHKGLEERIPYPPIQVYVLSFKKLRELQAPIHIKVLKKAQNYIVRDSILAVTISSLGGEVNTVTDFEVNSPEVVYTESDLHLALNLDKVWEHQ